MLSVVLLREALEIAFTQRTNRNFSKLNSMKAGSLTRDGKRTLVYRPRGGSLP